MRLLLITGVILIIFTLNLLSFLAGWFLAFKHINKRSKEFVDVLVQEKVNKFKGDK